MELAKNIIDKVLVALFSDGLFEVGGSKATSKVYVIIHCY